MYVIYRFTSTRCFRLKNSELHATIEEPLMEVRIIVDTVLSIYNLLYVLICSYAYIYVYVYEFILIYSYIYVYTCMYIVYLYT
jgi:hypothetical protein